jgi:hypothetical protein
VRARKVAQGGVDTVIDTLAILRMDAFEPPTGRLGRRNYVAPAEERDSRLIPALLALDDVPIPNDVSCSLGRQPVALFVEAQRLVLRRRLIMKNCYGIFLRISNFDK